MRAGDRIEGLLMLLHWSKLRWMAILPHLSTNPLLSAIEGTFSSSPRESEQVPQHAFWHRNRIKKWMNAWVSKVNPSHGSTIYGQLTAHPLTSTSSTSKFCLRQFLFSASGRDTNCIPSRPTSTRQDTMGHHPLGTLNHRWERKISECLFSFNVSL